MSLRPGTILNRYKVVSPLETGGVGESYVAVDTQLGRRVAVRFPLERSDEQQTNSLFLKEARSASNLSHANIATIFDYGEVEGRPYLVMELVDGESVAELIARKALSVAQSIDIVTRVAEAVAEAHRHGIIHRDIRSSNVLVNPRGEVKVLDFGLGKGPTISEASIESPSIASAEGSTAPTLHGERDIFAVGSLLYECLTGKPPNQNDGELSAASLDEREDLPPLPSQRNSDVSEELDRVTLKALATNPSERYESIEPLLADLQKLRPKSLGSSRYASRVNIAPKTMSASALNTIQETLKRPRFSLGVFLVIIVGLAGAYLLIRGIRSPKLHEPTAEAKKWYESGVDALREGSYFQASKRFEKAIAVDGQYSLAHARLAEALTELDSPDRAKSELLKVSSLVPEMSILPPIERHYLEGVMATITRQFPQAISSYSEITKALPNQAQAFVDLGRAYENSEDSKRALESYVHATELDSQYGAAYLRIGAIYSRRNQQDSALSAFAKADEIYQGSGNVEGRAEVFYQRGFMFNKNGNHKEARAQLQQSLDMSKVTNNLPQVIKSMLQMVYALHAANETDKAKAMVVEAMTLSRDNGMQNLTARALVDLGTTFLLQGKHQEADDYFHQALEAARRSNAPRNEARALLMLASVREQEGKGNEVIPYVQQALAFYQQGNYRNESALALTLLARAQRQQGDFQGALDTFRKLLTLSEQDRGQSQAVQAHEGIGEVLMGQAKYADALREYEEMYALSKSLNSPLFIGYSLMHRADALWRMGRYDEARRLLTEASGIAEQPGGGSEPLAMEIRLIQAEIALSELRYADAKTRSKTIISETEKTSPDAATQAKMTLCSAESRSGARAASIAICEDAAKRAELAGDSLRFSHALYALAQSQLANGDAERSLATALRADELLARAGNSDIEWRVWVVAALASRKLGDALKAREYATRASDMLEQMQSKIGTENYPTYLSRPDVQFLRESIGEFTDSDK